PEIIVKLFAARSSSPALRAIVVGELDILQETATRLDLPVHFADEAVAQDGEIAVRSLGLLRSGLYPVGEISAACGAAAFRYFEHAITECLAGRAHGIVTAPLNKEAMNRAGHA